MHLLLVVSRDDVDVCACMCVCKRDRIGGEGKGGRKEGQESIKIHVSIV